MAGIRRLFHTEKAYRTILTAAAICLLVIFFTLMDGQHNAAEENGGIMKVTRQMEPMSKDIPLIDQNIPTVTETATFALG